MDLTVCVCVPSLSFVVAGLCSSSLPCFGLPCLALPCPVVQINLIWQGIRTLNVDLRADRQGWFSCMLAKPLGACECPLRPISGRQSVHVTFWCWLSTERTWPKQVWKIITGTRYNSQRNNQKSVLSRVKWSRVVLCWNGIVEKPY